MIKISKKFKFNIQTAKINDGKIPNSAKLHLLQENEGKNDDSQDDNQICGMKVYTSTLMVYSPSFNVSKYLYKGFQYEKGLYAIPNHDTKTEAGGLIKLAQGKKP